jgi:hypothetical protein
MRVASSPAGPMPSFATTSRCTLTTGRTSVTRAATQPKRSLSCLGDAPCLWFLFIWRGDICGLFNDVSSRMISE